MYNKNIINSDVINPVNLTKKIYIWSIILEPMLFFVIWIPIINGWVETPFHISRLLQGYVIISLIIKILLKKNLYTYPNPLFSHYRYYFYYFILAFISGIYGMITSVYAITLLEKSHTYYLRPFIEYIIVIYYFVYFVVLFRFLIKKPEEINYFFKAFTFIFFYHSQLV